MILGQIPHYQITVRFYLTNPEDEAVYDLDDTIDTVSYHKADIGKWYHIALSRIRNGGIDACNIYVNRKHVCGLYAHGDNYVYIKARGFYRTLTKKKGVIQ